MVVSIKFSDMTLLLQYVLSKGRSILSLHEGSNSRRTPLIFSY